MTTNLLDDLLALPIGGTIVHADGVKVTRDAFTAYTADFPYARMTYHHTLRGTTPDEAARKVVNEVGKAEQARAKHI